VGLRRAAIGGDRGEAPSSGPCAGHLPAWFQVVSAVISSHATATGGLSAGILSALGPATGVVIAVAALGAVFMIASIAVTARRREPNLAVVQAAGADA
jgi:hypothetical protein